MFRVFRSLWIWLASAALIVLWTPVVAFVRLFDREPRRLRTARLFRRLGPLLAKVNPWRIHISGHENLSPGGVYVVVSNHQSLADIPLVAHLPIDAKWLGKAELFRIPIVGWMMQMAGDIPVDRTNRGKAARALLECGRYLRRRCSVVFFPEGTRSKDGQVLPFNDGPFQLAIREGIPVLPLVIEGSGSALPKATWLFGPAQDIHLKVLEAIPVEGWNVRQTADLRDTVRQRIVDELSRLRNAKHD